MIEEVKKEVNILLNQDNSGHGMDHIYRVLNLSLKFAEQENANKEIVSLIALLHDVDDYKLFGMECQENLTNARKIMKSVHIEKEVQEKVCDALQCIGYSKRLKGLEPNFLEGKIVSDADMCDALGAIGILRVYKYGLKINRTFFDKYRFPVEDTSENYHFEKTASTVNFMIEVLLKYKDLMLTKPGIEEAKNRHQIIVDFLYHLFEEENTPEWVEYFDNYLSSRGI